MFPSQASEWIEIDQHFVDGVKIFQALTYILQCLESDGNKVLKRFSKFSWHVLPVEAHWIACSLTRFNWSFSLSYVDSFRFSGVLTSFDASKKFEGSREATEVSCCYSAFWEGGLKCLSK